LCPEPQRRIFIFWQMGQTINRFAGLYTSLVEKPFFQILTILSMKFPLRLGVRGQAFLTVCSTFLLFGIPKTSLAEPPGSVEFTTEAFSGAENGGTIRVVLIRNTLFGDPFTVRFATSDGTAQQNVDYAPTNGTVQFVPGQTNAVISIRILDDSLFEGLETFSVTLSNPTAGATLGARRTATVTIVDDESITPGRIDEQFNPTGGANGTVFGIAGDDNDGVVIGGGFTLVNGAGRNGIAKLKGDGSLDTTFTSGLLYGEAVYAVARQADGKILIGGTFTSVSSVPRGRIARLLANGALDTSFDPGTGADDVVRSISIQSDGKIVIGGWFSQINGATRYRCARLNANGTVDPAFKADADGQVTSSLVLPDGRIVIGGGFFTVNGVSRVYAARLNSNGSVDEAFNPAGGNNVVNGTGIKALALQADGKVIVGADCSVMYGSGRIAINRLLDNGDLDRSFNPNVPSGSSVMAIAVQADGKVLVGGDFTRLADPTCCALHDRNGIARLNRDGSVDTSFDVGAGVNPAYVTALQVRSDLKVLAGGAFSTYNGTGRGGIVRIHGDMRARITDWNYNSGIALTIANQPGKTYVIEASTNMATWTPIATNTPTTSSFQFRDTNATSARLYRVRELPAQ